LASGRKSFDPRPLLGREGRKWRRRTIISDQTEPHGQFYIRLGKTVDVAHVGPAGRTGPGPAEPVARPGQDMLRARPSRGVPLSGSRREPDNTWTSTSRVIALLTMSNVSSLDQTAQRILGCAVRSGRSVGFAGAGSR